MLRLDAVSVENSSDEGGGQKSSDDNGSQKSVIGVVGWVGDKANVEEEHGEDGREEDLDGCRADGQDGGKSTCHCEEGPA